MMIIIDHDGDLVIKVVEDHQKAIPPTTTEFKVSKLILVENSPVFRSMLTSPHFIEGTQNVITLKGDAVRSMEIWFKSMCFIEICLASFRVQTSSCQSYLKVFVRWGLSSNKQKLKLAQYCTKATLQILMIYQPQRCGIWCRRVINTT